MATSEIDSRSCTECGEPVMAMWKACPACGTRLIVSTISSPPTLRPAPPPIIQAGNNSVVKAQINRSSNATTIAPKSESAPILGGQPLIHSGEGSVIRAEIDASTNIHNDHSLKVQGQYVANQTVVNESSAGTIVRLLTGAFTSADARKAEEQIQQLPNEPKQLQAILSQTLTYIIREAKKIFRQQEGLLNFNFNFNSSATAGKGYFDRLALMTSGIDSTNRQRLELCQKILDKLHENGRNSRDAVLLTAIDRLDTSLIKTEQLLRMFPKTSTIRMYTFIPVMAAFGTLVLTFAAKRENGLMFLLTLLLGGASAAAVWYFNQREKKMAEQLSNLEKTVNELSNQSLL